MTDEANPTDIDLGDFLKSAGLSFTDAQRSLALGIDVPVNMMLHSAELELKVAVSSDAQGKMSIRPVSSADITRGGIDPGLLSTMRVSFVSSIGEFKGEIPMAPGVGGSAKGNIVPKLLGLTLDEAVALLKAGGWEFEPHAAGTEEIPAGGEGRGRVLRQDPPAAKAVERAKTKVHFWADLGSIAVKEIDGIGPKLGVGLSKMGINSVGELSLASVREVASALRMSDSRAKELVDMAGMMSRLAILGFRDEVVELIVRGAGIRSMGQLADIESAELFRTCQEAIASRKVRVPRDFSLSADEVAGWVKAAAAYVGR